MRRRHGLDRRDGHGLGDQRDGARRCRPQVEQGERVLLAIAGGEEPGVERIDIVAVDQVGTVDAQDLCPALDVRAAGRRTGTVIARLSARTRGIGRLAA